LRQRAVKPLQMDGYSPPSHGGNTGSNPVCATRQATGKSRSGGVSSFSRRPAIRRKTERSGAWNGHVVVTPRRRPGRPLPSERGRLAERRSGRRNGAPDRAAHRRHPAQRLPSEARRCGRPASERGGRAWVRTSNSAAVSRGRATHRPHEPSDSWVPPDALADGKGLPADGRVLVIHEDPFGAREEALSVPPRRVGRRRSAAMKVI
jgi:hypothetical protein